MRPMAAALLLVLAPTAGLAQQRPIQDAAALEALLPGKWFAVDLNTGAPRNTAAGVGLDGCRGAGGGDLAFRRRDAAWELARGGGPFGPARVSSIMLGGRHLLQIGDQTIKLIKEAPDGTPRIFTYTGNPDDEVEISFQRRPAP